MHVLASALVFCAACGARSGLEIDPSEAPDTGVRRDAGAPRDAGRRDAGARELDAGDPSCPASPTIGFALTQRTFELGRTLLTASLATLDGSVYLVASEAAGGAPSRMVLRRFDETSGEWTVLIDLGEGAEPVLGVGDGRLAVASRTAERWARADILRPDGSAEWSLRTVLPSSVRRVAPPVHNGETWILTLTTGRTEADSNAWAGAIAPDGPTAWVGFGPVHEDSRAAVDLETGNTYILYRVRKDGLLRLVTVDRAGRLLDPRGQHLVGTEWEPVPDIGWTPALDGRWPVVLGGFSIEAEGARMRAERYDTTGAAGPAFSSGASSTDHRWALTTEPPPRHATGYGLAGAERITDDAWRISFHGAGEDFVGDSRDAGTSTGEHLALDITPSRCGYLIAWINGTTTLHTATAVPR